MSGVKKNIEIRDGIPHEVTIFIGDGKRWDETWRPGEPIREGSRLLRPLIDIEYVDVPSMTSSEELPWYLC